MRYAVCAEVDFDANAGTCAHVVWQESGPSLLPPLTASEGFAVSGAIAAVLTIAVVVRFTWRVGKSANAYG